MSNTAIWDALGKTDPAHTKAFSRAGGFKGTATKPIWVYRRLTEHFGPVGLGWGHGKPDYQVVPGADGETLVYCSLQCWHTNRENSFYGVGGDKVIIKDRNGLRSNDEAFKSAFTDAVMNAFKSVGVAADVHMGLFEDDKYVAAMAREFSGNDKQPLQSAKITDDQRAELMTLLDHLNVPVAEFLARGALKDLRELDAVYFDPAKKWINDRAQQMRKDNEKAA
jgi:hypothetical protein